MELLEIAKKRHSVRKYTGKEIEQEKLDKILEAPRSTDRREHAAGTPYSRKKQRRTGKSRKGSKYLSGTGCHCRLCQ